MSRRKKLDVMTAREAEARIVELETQLADLEEAVARVREVICELHVPGQTAWHWSDIETALDGGTE